MSSTEDPTLGIVLSIIPTITGSISFFASAALIWSIMKEKKILKSKERILIGLSILDMLFSLACSMSTFTAPEDIDPLTTLILRGNVATCNMQGWIYQVGAAAPMYNSILCIYLLMCIKYRWTDEQLKKLILPILHAVVLVWAIGAATAGLFLELYNFGGILGCWIDDAQEYYCRQGYDLSSCGRGDKSEELIWYFGVIPVVSALFVTIITTCMLYCHLRGLEKRARRINEDASYNSGYARSSFGDIENSPEDGRPTLQPASSLSKNCCQNRTKNHLSKQVLESGILYVFAFWITYAPFLIIACISATDAAVPDWLRVANVLLLPLQGLCNLLIYRLPRWTRYWRKRRQPFVSSNKSLTQEEIQQMPMNHEMDSCPQRSMDFSGDKEAFTPAQSNGTLNDSAAVPINGVLIQD